MRTETMFFYNKGETMVSITRLKIIAVVVLAVPLLGFSVEPEAEPVDCEALASDIEVQDELSAVLEKAAFSFCFDSPSTRTQCEDTRRVMSQVEELRKELEGHFEEHCSEEGEEGES